TSAIVVPARALNTHSCGEYSNTPASEETSSSAGASAVDTPFASLSWKRAPADAGSVAMPVCCAASAAPRPSADSAGFLRRPTTRSRGCARTAACTSSIDPARSIIDSRLRSISCPWFPGLARRSRATRMRHRPPRLACSFARNDPSAFERMQSVRHQRRRRAIREHLAAIRDRARIDRLTQPAHAGETRVPELIGEIRALLHADAVFARDRSAERDAHAEDLARERFAAFELS